MRQVIEWAIPWIHNAISGLHGSVDEKVIIDNLTTVKKALVDALAIEWETPEQYEKRTGGPLRDNAAVWWRHWLSRETITTNIKNYADHWSSWVVWNWAVVRDYKYHKMENYQLIVVSGPYPPPDEWRAK